MLHIYSMKVASGEWRDYAIDCLSDQAIFSVFRQARQKPLLQIVKSPKRSNRQGPYSIVCHGVGVLKRGHKLENVVKVLDKSLRLVK